MISYKASQLWNDEGYNIGVYSCHPGSTASNVLNALAPTGFTGVDSAEKSAKTPLFCAMNSKVGIKQSGQYFVNSKGSHCKHCKDENKVQKIWEYCYSLV